MRPWEKQVSPDGCHWARYHAWEQWMESRKPAFIPGTLEDFWSWWEDSTTHERTPLYVVMCGLADGAPDVPCVVEANDGP